MRKYKLNKVILIYILIYFLTTGLYCGINGTIIIGEWDDYTYPVVTLLTGHKISVVESDLPLIKDFFPEWSSEIDAIGINQLSGQHTRNGGMLPWYFPTYAIVCIPMICLLKWLGIPTTYAFCYTNLFSVIAALLVVYKYLKTKDIRKILLIVLLSINPIVFYYCWPSGETVIYAFLTIALVCWYNKWYKRAAIFISLAGTLNTTIMSVGIIMILEYLLRLRWSGDRDLNLLQFVKKNALNIIGYGFCYIIGLIPMVYFYYHTGYINLTASHASFLTGTGETTFQRFMAYLFDLNFGFLPYYPIILVLGIVLLVVSAAKKYWRYIEWFVAFVINVLLYSVMVHINSGMSGIARYNVWGGVILIFSVCLFGMDLVKKTIVKQAVYMGGCVNIIILLLIIYCYGPMGASKVPYIYWTPVAEWVLDTYPALYNPLHSTFASRTLHCDGGYNPDTPIVYSAEDGYVRKVLASESDADYLRETLTSKVNEE